MKKHFLTLVTISLAIIMASSCSDDTREEATQQFPTPVIKRIDPEQGPTGTSTTITGTNFQASTRDIIVEFNGVKADEISFSSTEQISTKVPAGATTGLISVTIGNQKTEGPMFIVDPDFTVDPAVGKVGTEVILTGDGFSSIMEENVVQFNGLVAVVNSSSPTSISTLVPKNATNGAITVTVNGQKFKQKGSDFVVSGIVETPVNFKVAFFGDTEIGANADAVLNLVKREGAQAVVHAGDLDYIPNPQAFEDNINGILGDTFPYFFSVGNHDDEAWNGTGGYQEFLESRFNKLGISWKGRLGVSASFSYKGVFFVVSAPDEFGITPSEAGNHIREELESDNSTWRVSFWHKNQKLMQIGGKSDEAGWEVYEASRKGGAIMATGHEHSYSRTYEMANFQSQSISTTDNTVNLVRDDPATDSVDEGRSFAFVSGLGGRGIRDNEDNLDQNPWWANVYHLNNGGQYGALFGEFNYNGDASLARFYFKDIDGQVRDTFFVRSHN